MKFLFSLILLCSSALAHAACIGTAESTTQGMRFYDNGDTVTDVKTGLMWRKCLLGLSGNDCSTGSVSTYTWANALSAASGTINTYSDWRLPNIKELQSLIEDNCYSPAIQSATFPNASAGYQVWSSTPYAGTPDNARSISFSTGEYINSDKDFALSVRLVRDNAPVYRQLINEDGLCLDVNGNSVTSGSQMVVDTCDPSHSGNQGWWFDPLNRWLQNEQDNSLCVFHNSSGNAFDGGPASLNSCSNNNQRRWVFSGNYIHNRHNRNFVLEATGTSAGNNVLQGDFTGSSSQSWHWLSKPAMIVDVQSGACATATSLSDGVNIDPATCTGAATQLWIYNPFTRQVLNSSNYNACWDRQNGLDSNERLKLETGSCSGGNNKFQFYFQAGYIFTGDGSGRYSGIALRDDSSRIDMENFSSSEGTMTWKLVTP